MDHGGEIEKTGDEKTGKNFNGCRRYETIEQYAIHKK